MVATGHVTAAAEMNLSYLPGGANAHPPIQCISLFFGATWYIAAKCILIGSAVLYSLPIAAAPGSIHRIHQVAPMCIPI